MNTTQPPEGDAAVESPRQAVVSISENPLVKYHIAFGVFWLGLALLAGLFYSMLSFIRITRLRREVEELREIRTDLVGRVRERVEKNIDPEMKRVIPDDKFT